MKPSNIFADLPTELQEEVFQVLEQSGGVKIERIVSRGHRSPASGWYDQDQYEWVLVMQGSAVLEFATGGRVGLQAGDYIKIAAHEKHKVLWTDPDVDTVWLAVFYPQSD